MLLLLLVFPPCLPVSCSLSFNFLSLLLSFLIIVVFLIFHFFPFSHPVYCAVFLIFILCFSNSWLLLSSRFSVYCFFFLSVILLIVLSYFEFYFIPLLFLYSCLLPCLFGFPFIFYFRFFLPSCLLLRLLDLPFIVFSLFLEFLFIAWFLFQITRIFCFYSLFLYVLVPFCLLHPLAYSYRYVSLFIPWPSSLVSFLLVCLLVFSFILSNMVFLPFFFLFNVYSFWTHFSTLSDPIALSICLPSCLVLFIVACTFVYFFYLFFISLTSW